MEETSANYVWPADGAMSVPTRWTPKWTPTKWKARLALRHESPALQRLLFNLVIKQAPEPPAARGKRILHIASQPPSAFTSHSLSPLSPQVGMALLEELEGPTIQDVNRVRNDEDGQWIILIHTLQRFKRELTSFKVCSGCVWIQCSSIEELSRW